MRFSKTLVVLFFLVVEVNAQTEKNIDHQSLLWIRYNNQLELNSKWSIQTDLDNRIFTKPVEQNLFVVRIQARKKWSDGIDAGFGFAYFQVATQEPENIKSFQVPEYRGQQDITVRQRFGKINWCNRFQLEERFVRKASQTALEEGTVFSFRFRYKIQAEYDLMKKEKQYLKAVLHNEIMINGGSKIVKNTFDQNRIYAALQYGISPKVAIELGYMNSFQERTSGVDYYNRDMVRLSFFHKLKL